MATDVIALDETKVLYLYSARLLFQPGLYL